MARPAIVFAMVKELAREIQVLTEDTTTSLITQQTAPD